MTGHLSTNIHTHHCPTCNKVWEHEFSSNLACHGKEYQCWQCWLDIRFPPPTQFDTGYQQNLSPGPEHED